MTSETAKGALRIRKIAIALLLLMPIAALGTRFGFWPFTIGIPMILVSVAGSLLIQMIIGIWLLRKPIVGTKNTLRWASLFALPPLLIIGNVILSSDRNSAALIHNISTDLNNPPAFVAAIEQRGENSNPLAYTSEVAEIQAKTYPNLLPLNTDMSPQAAFNQAVETATAMGWEVYAKNADDGRIEAVDTTFWFGFKDDIVIRVQPQSNGSRIDLRSVSRVGRSDMGVNAKRIARYMESFTSKNMD